MNLAIFLASFFAMELVANLTHRFVMHGFMWYFHEDHHVKNLDHFYEKNDIFFIVFSIPSIALINIGVFAKIGWSLAIGLGILAYGICYFLVHEVLIHRRLKFLDSLDNRYFSALRKAHTDHHSKTTKHGCNNFGMLLVPFKYFNED